MLDNAREHGVEVHEETRVVDILFEGARAVGVKVMDKSGAEREVRADVVVDAAGQSCLIQDRFNLREWDPVLKKAAVWTYWGGAYRDTGKDEGATIVMQTEGKQGWFWYIPLHGDKISVGVVAPYDYLFVHRETKDLEKIYFEEVAKCPGLQPRIANAERIAPFRAAKEYSYRSKEVAGDGWVLVGDAFGFLDPVFSSGVFLALKSGELAADAIDSALAADDVSAARFQEYGAQVCLGMERMRKIVYAFYNENFNFGKLVKAHPDLRPMLTDLLIGNVYSDIEFDKLFAAIEEICELPPDLEYGMLVPERATAVAI